MKKTNHSAKLYGINDLRYEESNFEEVCGDDEVVVAVKSCGICGSDLGRVYIKGTYSFPTVIGHEFSGKVIFDPKKELENKKVAVFPLIPCFKCDSCNKKSYATCADYDYYGSRRDGGMTEYITVKRWNVLRLPDTVSYDEGAMCEPISVARHAVCKLNIKKGENLFVSGAGAIGLIIGQWAKSFGANNGYYTDIDEKKLEFAEKMGFCRYKNGTKIDCAVEGTGHSDALKSCLSVVSPGGRVVFMGNPTGEMRLSQDTYWLILRKELKIFGTWNSSYSDVENDWKESILALAENKINVKDIITHKFPLSQCNKAFEMMKNKTEFYNKVILNMNGEI